MVNALNILGIKLRAVSDVWTFKKKDYDKLTVKVFVDVSKKYINVSKHKRILTPVINERIYLYINDIRLNEDEDEVFVVTEFYNSLTSQGKFPMFTCSCGIFGCGGFYIDVHYKDDIVIWGAEQSTYKKHLFSRGNIRLITEQLIIKLAEINDLRRENGLKANHDIEVFKTKLEIFLK
ncbi:hypothetical protein [Paenibacillus sp. V4I5]|uniref:hypothetical protein n=1 Tax=Paenibacillus sp. V4I5 TaxID=3042306 RepID=UPI00278FEB14|nr:hypothetical protein [Paenibacillus sp. V4I5]MDQ0914561.1 hypothetical protein [Paenibacillus sp. V4I5]